VLAFRGIFLHYLLKILKKRISDIVSYPGLHIDFPHSFICIISSHFSKNVKTILQLCACGVRQSWSRKRRSFCVACETIRELTKEEIALVAAQAR
jgi:hypothetical protein